MDEQQPLTKKQRRELRRQEKMESRERDARKGKTGKIIIAITVIVVVAGVGWLIAKNSGTSTTDTGGQLADPTTGAENAAVVVNEYSDFQCPACGAAEPTVKQMLDQYGDRITFIYNDFPLTSIHPNAMNAALAGQCAFKQSNDAFWTMHDMLFDHQSGWSSKGRTAAIDDFKSYAADAGLDTAAFNTCLDNGETKDAITDDQNEARAKNVNSTPTFFVNDERVVGGTDLLSTVAKALGE